MCRFHLENESPANSTEFQLLLRASSSSFGQISNKMVREEIWGFQLVHGLEPVQYNLQFNGENRLGTGRVVYQASPSYC